MSRNYYPSHIKQELVRATSELLAQVSESVEYDRR